MEARNVKDNSKRGRLVELVLIRHGQTEGNRAGRYVGRRDESVCESGIEELRAMKEAGLYPPIERLYASPMKRCLETGKILYPHMAPCIVEGWKEMDFGIFEGRNYQEMENWPQYQAWVDSGGTMAFPGGESREAFAARTLEGLVRVMDGICEESHPPGRIGALVHGGVIMSLMSQIAGGDYYSYMVGNGRGYRCKLVIEEGQICLLGYEKG